MTEPVANRLGNLPSRSAQPSGQGSSANLADILERVLDKGIVIAGDIQINLLDIELLTIKLRLLVASVDKAKEMGIDWWEHDPALSSRARDDHELVEENRRLRAEVEALREGGELPPAQEDDQSRPAVTRRPARAKRPERAEQTERAEGAEQSEGSAPRTRRTKRDES
ncbi:gas vesicle protein [Streptomyces sp. NPDC048248]|uniref:gas vesicle protein n=1 Tax=Streptomyces sp. NPDC048248 TaxID=3365523 RepID=UPI0037230033